MSADLPSDRRHSGDGSAVSRPSKNNRHAGVQGGEPAENEYRPRDLPDEVPALQPVAVEEQPLRDEAVIVRTEAGMSVPMTNVVELDEGDEVQGRPMYRVLNEFVDWYEGYESAHITYESPEGEQVRTRLENSHQPEYGDRYYARLKDLERGIERQYESLSTAMLTFTASHENAHGNPRCPGDHMREIAEGWRNARKLLHKSLSGRNWEYARIWEPHEDGYGHLHVAVFIEGEVSAGAFEPVMRSYVGNVKAAGSEAHSLENAVSVNDSVGDLGCYLSEYLGAYGESVLDRPVSEQVFRATCWATNTRRLDFSNGAQEIIAGEKFRRETGLRPEDRGQVDTERREALSEASEGWSVDHIEYVVCGGQRERADPTAGGVSTSVIDGRPESDPPPEVT